MTYANTRIVAPQISAESWIPQVSNVIEFDFKKRVPLEASMPLVQTKGEFETIYDYLLEIDHKLDLLDEIQSHEKVGPLSLLLCNLEAFTLGVELDERSKKFKKDNQLGRFQLLKQGGSVCN